MLRSVHGASLTAMVSGKLDRRSVLTGMAAIPCAAMTSACRSLPTVQANHRLFDAPGFVAARQYAEVPSGRIAYVAVGDGPVAIFLHGFPLNGFQWRKVMPRLSALRRCVAIDLMGLGFSEVADGQDLSPQAQSDMLARFLDRTGIEAVDLIANDSGGTIAQLFAVQHTHRVRTMLLTNCDVDENSPPPQMGNSIAAARAGIYDQKIARHALDHNYARSPSGIGGSAYVDPATLTDEAADYYFRVLVESAKRRDQLNCHLAAFEPNPLVAIRPALQRLRVPTRMVWGTADQLFPVKWAAWLDRTLPESRGIRSVEGGKLFWPEEQPEILAQEAKQLWRA